MRTRWAIAGVVVVGAWVLARPGPEETREPAPAPRVTTEIPVTEARRATVQLARILGAIPCPALRRVDGRVLSPDGGPVRSARVFVGDEARALSDEEGAFSVVNPATRTVEVRVEGHAPWSMDAPVCVDTWHVEAVLRATSDVRGLVLADGEPVAGASIRLEGDDGVTLLSPTGESGRFHLERAAFPSTIVVEHPRFGAAEYVVDAPGDVVIELEAASMIRGVVFSDEAGTVPQRRFSVVVTTAEFGPVMQFDVDSEDGSFVIGELGDARYIVLVEHDGRRSSRVEWPQAASDPPLPFVLQKTVPRAGLIVDENGEPAAGVLVEAESPDNHDVARTGEDGRFEIDVTPGELTRFCALGQCRDFGEGDAVRLEVTTEDMNEAMMEHCDHREPPPPPSRERLRKIIPGL